MTTQILYLIGSLAGVAAMVGLCVLLFGRGVATVDADTAAARLAQDVPGFRAGAVALSTDGHAALVEDARDRSLHLVVARGDGLVTRHLSKSTVKAAMQNGAALTLRLADVTFPKASLLFADDVSARDWQARLS